MLPYFTEITGPLHHPHRELTDDDVAKIAGTYYIWRGDKGAGPLPAKAQAPTASIASPAAQIRALKITGVLAK